MSRRGLLAALLSLAYVVSLAIAPLPVAAQSSAGPTACQAAASAAATGSGFTDEQVAHAYGFDGLYAAGDLGAGQTIAVVDVGAAPAFQLGEVAAFDQCYFGADHTGQITVVPVDGGTPLNQTPGPTELEIEDISALAPAARIVVYDAPDTFSGILDAYRAAIAADSAQLVLAAQGLCEQAVQQGMPGLQADENLLFQQAASQGQTVLAAAGNRGSDACDASNSATAVSPKLSVSDPASQPYVVAVGGTTLFSTASPPQEAAWNDGAAIGAGGGGISESWPMPTWQLDSGVPGVNAPSTVDQANGFESADLGTDYGFCLSDAAGGQFFAACRELPDVSALASTTHGITAYMDGAWTTAGGTASAAAIWAAALAEVNASSACASPLEAGRGVGFAAPLLYAVAAQPTAYAASFNDVTQGSNDLFGASSLFPATTGYDMATGLGSPRLTSPTGVGLAHYLCAAAVSSTRPAVVSVLTPAGSPTIPTSSPYGSLVTITGAGFVSGQVTGVEVNGFALPSSAIVAVSATSVNAEFPPASLLVPPGTSADGAGDYQVQVTLKDGETSAPGPGSTIGYVDTSLGNTVPAVTAVGSSAGPLSGDNTVDILGSGFTGATAVAFGGVPVAAGGYSVVSDTEIVVNAVPPYASGTTTCAQDGSAFGPGESAADDICQVAVTVTNANGISSGGSPFSCQGVSILPALEGTLTPAPDGAVAAPPGDEAAPRPCEYDYLPAPSISRVSTSAGPFAYASETGTTSISLDGSGFNRAGLDSVVIGDTSAPSELPSVTDATGTHLVVGVTYPLAATSVDPVTLPISVVTAAGTSNGGDLTFAGIPTVNGLSVATGASTGGEALTVSGQGFAQARVIRFVPAPGETDAGAATQYNFTEAGDTTVTLQTPPVAAGTYNVEVCSVSGCSAPSPASTFVASAPGLTSVAGDGTGAVTVSPTTVVGATTGNKMTFTYSAPATGGTVAGSVYVQVPAGWSAPSFLAASTGSVSFSGSTIRVSGVSLPPGGELTVTYAGATAPGTGGVSTFTTSEASTAGGTLEPLAPSPSVQVLAPDGSGSVAVAPAGVLPGSAGNSLTFTYTAAPGGMRSGSLSLTVPAGWSLPSSLPAALGFTSASTGALSISGRTVEVSGLTLGAGGTVSITYGDTTQGGPGADAQGAIGSASFGFAEASVASDTPAPLAQTPTVAVGTSTSATGLAPGAPTGVVATPGDASATVTWQAPASVGGGPITAYTVQSDPSGFEQTVAGSVYQATVTGLQNDTSYSFTVSATNTVGAGPASVPSNAVKPGTPASGATAPGAPTAVVATAGIGAATVTWEPPASDGGSPISSYTVVSEPSGFTDTVAGSVYTATLALANGTSYTFTVTAANLAGPGAASVASNAVEPEAYPAGATPPGAPVRVTAQASDGAAVVSWQPPASTGGSPLTGYIVASSGGLTEPAPATATQFTLGGLHNGTSYTFTVTAANAVGAGAVSAASNAVTPASGATPPAVGALSPGVGPATGGTLVTISGSGFDESTQVLFGAAPAERVLVQSATSVLAVAPPGTGTVTVAIETTSGIAASAVFAYQPSPLVVTRPLWPGWNYVSIPFTPSTTRLASLMSDGGASLLAAYAFSHGRWTPLDGRQDQQALDQPMAGLVLYIAGSEPVSITFTPATTTSLPGAPPLFSLDPGWNLIGPSAAAGQATDATFLAGTNPSGIVALVDLNGPTVVAVPNPAADSGHNVVDGYGYWVYVSAAGQSLVGQIPSGVQASEGGR